MRFISLFPFSAVLQEIFYILSYLLLKQIFLFRLFYPQQTFSEIPPNDLSINF